MYPFGGSGPTLPLQVVPTRNRREHTNPEGIYLSDLQANFANAVESMHRVQMKFPDEVNAP